MKKRQMIMAILICFSSVVLGDPPGDSSIWHSTPVLEDNFNSITLGSTETWRARTDYKHYSQSTADNITVSNGVLQLEVSKESGTYYCAGIISNDAFKYGYYEISAKIPDTPGWHPAFWMYGGGQEIDAFEFDTGDSYQELKTQYHDLQPSLASQVGLTTEMNPDDTANDDPHESFHVYGLEWNPYVARYYAYGNLVDIRTCRDDLTDPNDTHTDQELWLSVIKSSDDTVVDNDLPRTFKIDYVKIWERVDEDGPGVPLSLMFDFEEGSGTVYDLSDKGHSGTLYGDAAFSGDSQKGDYSITFDSSGDSVEITDSDYLDDTAELTISAWVKPNDIGSGLKPIVCKRTSLSSGAYLVYSQNGRIYVDINEWVSSERVYTSSSVLTANEWNHVAVVYDGDLATGKVKIYVGGAAASTGGTETDTSIGNGAQPLCIGAFNDRNESFDGEIDDVKIWKRALSSGEVAILAGYPALNLQFEDGNTLTAHDVSGHGNNGTLNDVWWTTDSKKGNYAMQFVKKGTYVEVSDSSILESTSKMTFMVWIKPSVSSSDTVNRGLFSKRVSYNNEQAYSIYMKGDDVYVDIDGWDSSKTTSASGVFTQDQWVHLAIVYDGTIATSQDRVTIYKDGDDVNTTTTNGPDSQIGDYDSSLYIGCMNPGGNGFEGLIDDVRIYRSALSEVEIEDEMDR